MDNIDTIGTVANPQIGRSESPRKDGHLSLWANQRPAGWRATIGLSPNEPQRLAESDDPVREKASVMDLCTGEVREFDAVSERDFDAVGAVLCAARGPCDMSDLLCTV